MLTNSEEKSDLTLEGLAHDLNNVFQTIGDCVELLRSDARWTKLAGTLQRSADHGQRLVQSILERKRSTSEAASVIDSAIEFTRDYLECMHSPLLDISVEVESEVRLPGDPGGWERVLVNLFVNAAEAGAKHVHVCVSHTEIAVCDDGPGIAPELLPHIFLPHVSSKQPHVSSKSSTSGLGLHVVQSLVQDHGGAVVATNLPTGGARFVIDLPHAEVTSNRPETPAQRLPPGGAYHPPGSSCSA